MSADPPGRPADRATSASSSNSANRATPTPRTFDLPTSGPGAKAPLGRRVGAYFIDAIASAAIAALFVRRHDMAGLAAHLPGYWSLVPLAVDYLVGLTLVGQTLGMRLTSLRVIRTDRPVPIGLARAASRTFLLFLFIPALVFDRANRGLHDRISDTVVVSA